MKVKVTQLCLTLCNLMDYTVHGILQARIPEWVAFTFSRAFSQPRDWTQVSCIGRQILYHWATWEALLPLLTVAHYPVVDCSELIVHLLVLEC